MSKPPVTGLRERIGETRRLYENEEKFFEAVKSHRHVLEELPRVLEMLDAAAAEKLREEAVDLGKPEITRQYTHANFLLNKANELRGTPASAKNVERFIGCALALRSSIRALRADIYILKYHPQVLEKIRMLCDRVAEMSAIEDPQNKTELAKYEAALVKRAGAAGRYINGLPIDLEHKLKLRGDIRKLLEKKLRTTSDGMPKK